VQETGEITSGGNATEVFMPKDQFEPKEENIRAMRLLKVYTTWLGT
jgi:hypothetical protein